MFENEGNMVNSTYLRSHWHCVASWWCSGHVMKHLLTHSSGVIGLMCWNWCHWYYWVRWCCARIWWWWHHKMLGCNMMGLISLCWCCIVQWLLHRWNLMKNTYTTHKNQYPMSFWSKEKFFFIATAINQPLEWTYQFVSILCVILNLSLSKVSACTKLCFFFQLINHTRIGMRIVSPNDSDRIFSKKCSPDKNVVVEQRVDDVGVLEANATDSSCYSWLIVDLGKLKNAFFFVLELDKFVNHSPNRLNKLKFSFALAFSF